MKRFFGAILISAATLSSSVLGQMAESAAPTAPSLAPAPASPPSTPRESSVPTPSSPQPPAPVETLRTLRNNISQGKLKGAAELCDRLRGGYEAERSILIGTPDTPPAPGAPPAMNNRNQAAVQTYMACYCIYAKSQVLSLTGDIAGAEAALADAHEFRTKFPEFSNPRVQDIMLDLDAITAALIQEKAGKLDAAVQAYLPASQAGTESAIATGRLAMIELKRGHLDKAQSWAYIHADDPTSQYVLAQIAAQKKNLAVAQKHATTAIQIIQKQLKDGKEYMPAFYVETPAIRALSKKLPPLPAAPKPAAPPKPAAAEPAPAPAAPKPAPAPAPSAAPGMTPMMTG